MLLDLKTWLTYIMSLILLFIYIHSVRYTKKCDGIIPVDDALNCLILFNRSLVYDTDLHSRAYVLLTFSKTILGVGTTETSAYVPLQKILYFNLKYFNHM